MRIVVTGATGFIGTTLRLRLAESGHSDVASLGRDTPRELWSDALAGADVVVHLAGVNRPTDVAEYAHGNAELTERVCAALSDAGRRATIILSSSIQAERDHAYGASKRAAESAVERYAATTGARGCVLRLPNVFGKWARPNYNSAVATFCHNIARGIPIIVHDPASPVSLIHVDDVVDGMLSLFPPSAISGRISLGPVHQSTVGEVVALITSFAESRVTLMMPRVGTGLVRALYSAYVSYLPPAAFAYDLVRHEDPRGVFSELLRTTDSGQISYFSAHPGITRGGHYHHAKTEKFLVVHGRARFCFRHVVTGEQHSIDVDGAGPRVVETVPGWAHDITNIGDTEMIVLLWANEVFDPSRPDTVAARVSS